MTKMMNSKMNKTMTAACAGAAFCCACAASYTAILSVLGAIIMASIIIARLFALSILGLLVLVLVLVLVVLLITAHFDTPWTRNPA